MQHAGPGTHEFIPHGFCYLWDRSLLLTHVGSDLLIGLSYVAISLSLVYMVQKANRQVPFSWLLVAFGLFIVACGGTHFMEIWTLWHANYWAAAGVKVVTAAASVATAAAMPVMVPRGLATIHDASRTRALAGQLETTLSRLDYLVRSSPAVLYSRSAAAPYALTFVGENLTTVFGGSPAALVDNADAWMSRVHPDDQSLLRATLERTIREREAAAEYRLRDDTGTYRWVLDQMRYVGDDPSRSPEIVGWWTESTERHAADEARRQLDRLKGEFVSTVSHELRTPLTAIRGALGLVAGGKVGPLEQRPRELVQLACDNTDRLVRLINEMLDLDKIESGQLELRLAVLQPADLVDVSVDSLRPIADQYGIRLEKQEAATQGVLGDKDRLIQVMTNLIANAIKFATPRTTVRVTCFDLVADESGASCVRFAVENEGPGIAAADLPRLFQRFSQLDAGDNRKRGGTGLGLAISKSIVEQHGGRIGVRSEPNDRTTFWFEIPARCGSESDNGVMPGAGIEPAQGYP